MTEIYIEKCRKDAKLPSYAHDGDAGMDLYAAEEGTGRRKEHPSHLPEI